MISTRGRYALRVMTDIAENGGGNYITLCDIARRQGISEKYLESILVILTRGNLLNGLRGKGGGYKLTKAPSEYTEGSLAPVACLKQNADVCARSDSCKTLPLWKGLDKVLNDYLQSVKLSDLCGSADSYCI